VFDTVRVVNPLLPVCIGHLRSLLIRNAERRQT
jgi:hypothetical protein